VNWKLKAAIQLGLAYAPFGERINYALQKIKGSHSPANVDRSIPDIVAALALASNYVKLKGSTVVEIGTGWVPTNTILLYLAGASRIYTYDHVPHLRLEGTQLCVEQLMRRLPLVSEAFKIAESVVAAKLQLLQTTSLAKLLERAGIVYHAPADASQTGLLAGSIDLVCSYAVLEHVPEKVVHALVVESKRILKASGVSVHAIGLHDHYASDDPRLSLVNFLKYPEWQWRLIAKNRVHYQNRLREKHYFQLLESHGAKLLESRHRVEERDVKAAAKMHIDRRFHGLSPDELAVQYTEIVYAF
jgi:hypothetical protein